MLSLFNVRSSPSINITHAHIVAQREPIKDEYKISPGGKSQKLKSFVFHLYGELLAMDRVSKESEILLNLLFN